MAFRGLLVTDLDGTLVSFETGEMPAANRLALLRAEREGILVAIATGRRMSGFARERARLAGLRVRVSLSNGAILLAEDNETPVAIHSMPWEGALELARVAQDGVHALLAITAPSRDASGIEAPDCHVFHADGRVVAAGSPWNPATHREVEAREATGRPLVHAALHVASRELAERLEPLAREILGIREGSDAGVEVHVVRSPGGGGALLEVVVAGGKGRAVLDLAAEAGLGPGAIAAIGDDMNDARMLAAAGHRYAVGGSVLGQRVTGAIATRTAEEGAVADALDGFLRALDAAQR